MGIDSLYGYRRTPPGLLLYLQRNLFVPISERALTSADECDRLIQRLTSLGVKNI